MILTNNTEFTLCYIGCELFQTRTRNILYTRQCFEVSKVGTFKQNEMFHQ